MDQIIVGIDPLNRNIAKLCNSRTLQGRLNDGCIVLRRIGLVVIDYRGKGNAVVAQGKIHDDRILRTFKRLCTGADRQLVDRVAVVLQLEGRGAGGQIDPLHGVGIIPCKDVRVVRSGAIVRAAPDDDKIAVVVRRHRLAVFHGVVGIGSILGDQHVVEAGRRDAQQLALFQLIDHQAPRLAAARQAFRAAHQTVPNALPRITTISTVRHSQLRHGSYPL